MELMDKVTIVKNLSNHPFQLGEEVMIFRISEDGYDVCREGDCWRVNKNEIKKINMKVGDKVTLRKSSQFYSVENDDLSNPYGIPGTISEMVANGQGLNIHVNWTNGTGNSYNKSDLKLIPTNTTKPKVSKTTQFGKNKTSRIGRKKALELIRSNGGKFFTATFYKKNGDERVINGSYIKDQNESLGLVKVREMVKAKEGVGSIRQVNIQTLTKLKIKGQSYLVR